MKIVLLRSDYKKTVTKQPLPRIGYQKNITTKTTKMVLTIYKDYQKKSKPILMVTYNKLFRPLPKVL
jgi:hypothetical protein